MSIWRFKVAALAALFALGFTVSEPAAAMQSAGDPGDPEEPAPAPPPPMAPLSGPTLASEPQLEWEKRQNPDERLRAYGPDLLGDQIDPNTGGITRTYDANGNVASATRDGGAVWTYLYTKLDGLQQEKLVVDGRTYQFDYAYTNSHYVTTRTRSGGPVFSFDPDAFGRPRKAAVGATDYVSGVSYHPNGMISGATYLNGQVLSQTLTPRKLPSVLKTTKTGSNAIWLTYGYEERGLVASITDTVTPAENRSFVYDNNGRLLTASGPWGAGSFSYDAEGNLRQQVLGARTITVSYDGTNRATSANDNGAVKSYAYDARGNATTAGANTFGYDFANRPTSVSGGVSGTYAYDANLKRVKSVVGGDTAFTVYSALTGGLILKDDLAASKTTDYVSAGGASVRLVNGTAVEYTHADHLGSPLAATDASGAVTWRESYNPFGEKRIDPAANADNTGFTGHLSDDATDLVYMQARYYDPVIGRFLSTDPIGYQDQLNLYAYVGNDPVNFFDPIGEDTITVRFRDQPIHYRGPRGQRRTIPQSISGGHSGIVIVDDSGTTRYREYGRYGDGGAARGRIERQQFPILNSRTVYQQSEVCDACIEPYWI